MTRKNEKFILEKDRRIYGKAMRVRTEDTRNGYPYLLILRIHDAHLALSAGAFELYHISAEREQSDNAHNTRTAMRTAIGYSCLFCVKYHITIISIL